MLTQSLAEIFKDKSKKAKDRDALKEKIEKGKEILEKIKKDEVGIKESIPEFVYIFYSKNRAGAQIEKLEKLDEMQVHASFYYILSSKIEELERIEEEIQEYIKGNL